MKPLYKIIESIPHGVILGDSIKEGPVTQVFKARFEGIEAMLRVDLPVAKTLGLNRIFEAELLESIQPAQLSPKVLFADNLLGVLIWEFQAGETLENKSLVSLPEQLGYILKQIHGTKIDGSEPLFADAIENYRQLLKDFDHPLIEPGFTLFDSLKDAKTSLVLSHNDINPGNILAKEGLFVLDWEYASLNHPYFDLSNAIENFNFNDEEVETFLHSYGETITEEGIDRLNRWRNFSLYLALFWLMIIEKYATIQQTEQDWMIKLENRLLQLEG